jgi:hypothetical protein
MFSNRCESSSPPGWIRRVAVTWIIKGQKGMNLAPLMNCRRWRKGLEWGFVAWWHEKWCGISRRNSGYAVSNLLFQEQSISPWSSFFAFCCRVIEIFLNSIFLWRFLVAAKEIVLVYLIPNWVVRAILRRSKLDCVLWAKLNGQYHP